MLPTYPFEDDPGSDHSEAGRRLLDQTPVARARLANDGSEVWLALSHRAVRQVLSDARFSREAAARPEAPMTLRVAAMPDMLPSMDPPRHTKARRLMASAFGPRMIAQLEPLVRGMVQTLLDGLDSPCDLVDGYAEPLPIMVICELLGVPYEDRERIRDWATRLIALTAYTREEIEAAMDQIAGYLGDLIAERRAAPDDRLISELVKVNDREGILTPNELIVNVRTLLVAGHETTVNQIGNSLVTLFGHPEQLKLLSERPDLWPAAVDELLRYSMLTDAALPRVALEDFDLDGVRVTAGEAVVPLIGVANRDPVAYPDPHRFDIQRDAPAPHLGLGHGPHFCLGAQLARLELLLTLRMLFERHPEVTPAVPLESLQWWPGLAMRSLRSLPVRW
ncbi:cytochrome P450 [Streptomyces sp. NPDC058548]|uniref:cytochrome P450 n=1 Tax=unclassified Streptomyces TaxID=2593676 RepID=UPI00364D0CF1